MPGMGERAEFWVWVGLVLFSLFCFFKGGRISGTILETTISNVPLGEDTSSILEMQDVWAM